MAIAWRAGASNKAESTQNASFTIPGTVQAGDFLLLGYIINSGTADTGGQAVVANPSGWTLLPSSSQSDSSTVVKAWYKIAGSGDAGTTVTITYTGATAGPRNCAIFGAWSGVDNTSPLAVTSALSASTTSSTSHVMPTLDTTGHDQCMIVSMLLDRSPTASTSFSASSGWTLRQSQVTTGASGQPEGAIIDKGPVTTGASGQGGGTITGDQAANHNYGFTLALAPATAVQTARPNVDVTTTNWTPSTAPGDGVPMCSLVADQSDGTYVETLSSPTSQQWEAKLPTMAAAPNTVTSRVYFAGGATSGEAYVALVQGTTVIASTTQTWASDPPTSPTDVTVTLDEGEKGDVTNLADLRIRTELTAA